MKYYKLNQNYKNINGINVDTGIYMKEDSYGMGTYPDHYINKYDSVDYICKYPLDELSDFPCNSGCYLITSLPLFELLSAYNKKNLLSSDSYIYSEDITENKHYKIIHITNEVNAINKEKTKYHEFLEQHFVERTVDHSFLFFQNSKLKNKHLFRVKDLPGHYYISETLKNEIESHGFTGISFQLIESL